MAKFPVNSLLHLSRRSYAVVAENVRTVQTVILATKKVVVESSPGSQVVPEQKEIFWMRDPTTGNWIPENHFGEIDSAELRAKYLPRKEKL